MPLFILHHRSELSLDSQFRLTVIVEGKSTFLKQCFDSFTPLKSLSPPPKYLQNKVQTSGWPLPPSTVLTCKFCPLPLWCTRQHSILSVSWIGLSSFLYCAWFTPRQPEILHFSHSPLKAHFWVWSTQWGRSLSSLQPTPPHSASFLAWNCSLLLWFPWGGGRWLCLPCCCLFPSHKQCMTHGWPKTLERCQEFNKYFAE